MHDPDPPLFFATASRGTEDVLADEMSGLGIDRVDVRRAGVAFGSDLEDAYRACLWSRVASRVLMRLASFEATDADALYAGVHAVRWTDHLGPERTLAVNVAGSDSPVGPSHFIALKVKDAIVDRIRETEGARPDVDKRRPDVRIHVHTSGEAVTVSLDLAGRGLHRRGLGRQGAVAPLRENLAAALVRIAGWPERSDAPLVDPMCGSGTLLSEAAGMALGVAPGLGRDRTGVEGWRGHDRTLWRRLREEAKQRRSEARRREIRVAGFDVSPDAVSLAREMVHRAGFGESIRIRQLDLQGLRPPWDEAGTLVTNPPYGERIGEAGDLGPLYERLGDVLRRRFPGWSAWILSGNPALDKRIGLRPVSKRVVFNGAIRCRFLEIPISTRPVSSQEGPAWRKPSEEAKGFAKRLAANLEERRKQARRDGLSCYRVYDSDVPVYNLAVDWYDGVARVEEYPRPRKVKPDVADRRLRDALAVVSDVLDVHPSDVILRAQGRPERFREVKEGDLRFRVNLEGFPHTGLALDERLLRSLVRAKAQGRDFLNLFASTCTASVAAAKGGARTTTSVDLSRNLLDWGQANFDLNGIPKKRHLFVRVDPTRFLDGKGGRRYGLILASIPADPADLVSRVSRLLAPGGEILLVSHRRDTTLDGDEMTEEVTPFDFRGRPGLRAWRLVCGA